MLSRMRNHIKQVKYPSLNDHILFWTIMATGVVADLWSKTAVFKWLGWEETPDRVHPVIEGFFTIVMRVNYGAAWSIATGQRVLLLSVSVIALFVVIGIFILGNIRHKLMEVALALFTAGIIGNLYDRAFNGGGVRDFLDFNIFGYPWPAFNIADSMLCVAVGLLIIFNFKHSGNDGDSPDSNKTDS